MTDFIDDLVKNLKPVQLVPSLKRRVFAWFVASAVFLGITILFTGIRVNVAEIPNHPFFIFETAVVIVLAVLGAVDALRESIPGEKQWPRPLAISLFSLWALLSAFRLGVYVFWIGPKALIPDVHLACAVITIFSSALASIPLMVLLRRAAPLDPSWCGALTGLSSAGIAMIAIQLYCVYRTPAHIIVWHVLPVIGSIVIGMILGKRLLSPWPQTN